ncbi:sugar phosphate isomerase/epimerase family protein [Humitalea sp. 24SJ18S-53]|uniref:sugar phosphate isomerase/epimerase family protein n=1 Tax=Humitalea sp. 24SJ18S-53 TaxID=3422307 RepID=UPI003D679B7B
MRFSLCNEVIRDLSFPAQCVLARKLGYDGLELAPFTLDAEAPHLLPAAARAELRRIADAEGVALTGLHWLLVAPAGLSISHGDARTLDVMARLVGLAADLGMGYLVHGSPFQRVVTSAAEAAHAEAAMAYAARCAADAGVTYVLEPLAPPDNTWCRTVAEAVAIIDRIQNPALRTMIDTSAAGNAEAEAVPDLIRRWLPSGHIAHIHLNDRNRRGPGQGGDRFAPILGALHAAGYGGICGVEPFDYIPDGPGCAARAIGYLRGIEEALTHA